MVRESELSFIADAAGLEPGDTVLEIGPGLGFLTRFLFLKRVHVLAVEKDKLYARFLRTHFRYEDFILIENDILKIDLKRDFKISNPVKIVGNIPFNITSPILEWLIGQRSLVSSGVLTTQKELAERLAAQPWNKSWGALSLFLRVYADVFFLKRIGRDSFYPAPKVDSAVIRLEFLKTPRFSVADETLFFKLARRAFQKRRKTILNALTDETDKNLSKRSLSAALKRSDIDVIRRPETLTIAEWAKLSETLE
jgi:16S rRNA (adenine1518-N6/adenine1519-N6)-dimethyltransferase